MTMTFKLASFFGIIALAYMFVKAFHSVIVYRARHRKKSGDFELKLPNPAPTKRTHDFNAAKSWRSFIDQLDPCISTTADNDQVKKIAEYVSGEKIAWELDRLREDVKAGKIDDFTASTKLAVLTAKRMEEPDVWKPLPMAELQKRRKSE